MWNTSSPAREPSSPGLLLQPEAREHRLETCRSDLDVCHWLEAERNAPLRRDREKGRPGETPAREVGIGVVSLAGHGQEARAGWAAGQWKDYLCVKVRKPFLERCHPSSLPYSAGR